MCNEHSVLSQLCSLHLMPAQWRRERQIDTLLDADRVVCLPATQDFIARVYPHAFHGAAIGNRTVRNILSGFVRFQFL